MTPKEKAEDLVFNYQQYVYCFLGSGMLTNTIDKDVEKSNAKQCALIAVDEQIDNAEICLGRFRTKNDMIEVRDYWRQVRNEIEKL